MGRLGRSPSLRHKGTEMHENEIGTSPANIPPCVSEVFCER